jgi:DNA-binding transcriptional LysR family regulator
LHRGAIEQFYDVVELHHLRCAVAIADHGTFTAAAAALHVSQPTLSYAISRLERELGVRLFERTPHGARPTGAGDALLGPARRAIAESESGRAAVAAIRGVVAGELRVAGIRTAAVETARHVAAFRSRHPGVRLSIEDLGSDDDVAELVRSGRCDVGMMRAGAAPVDLVAVGVDDQVRVVLFPARAAPRARSVAVADLAGVPLIVPLAGTRIRALGDAHLRAAGVVPIVACECSHVETAIELVRGGVGALITSASVAATVRSGGVAVRSIKPRTTIPLAIVSRPSPSPAAVAFCRLAGQ